MTSHSRGTDEHGTAPLVADGRGVDGGRLSILREGLAQARDDTLEQHPSRPRRDQVVAVVQAASSIGLVEGEPKGAVRFDHGVLQTGEDRADIDGRVALELQTEGLVDPR